MIRKTDNFVPLVDLGTSTNCGSNSSSTSTLDDFSSTSPVQERSDGPAPGDWCGSFPKTQNQSEKSDGSRDSNYPLRDFPEWLEEFKENLEDRETLVSAHISHDSDSERRTKVASRRHSILSWLPKAPELRNLRLFAEDATRKEW